MAKQIFVSKEGYQKLENELEHLKTVKRKEVAMAIQKARSFGDLSENSEYDEAKNEQAEIESRIAMLEVTLENATILDDKDIKTDKVSVGNSVKIYNIATEQEEEYRIVGSTESDPIEGKISDDCPLGKTLLGQRVGDSINVETPGGIVKYTVISISK
ncbi:MAG: transcription elongation factor GreA [Clostridia bacterium]|nr:transcription elongation factor GreA [Clostridia bacterium]MBO7216198.1 transcription elongation factor GreA [Clostridia bacterium]MBO7245172.1 transcription elongation factor GreA [Clostridia bacterium]MBO7737240.1 transcription elongation factor GreA [Clostridia bacterium]